MSVDALDFNRVSAAAFERWYEMAPVEARTAAIAEMMRPRPRFGAEDLGMVGDEPLPAVDHTLVEHLAQLQNFDAARNIASLIQRFATPAVESDVVQILDRDVGKSCAIQAPLLAYLLKADPAAARPRLDTAIAARTPGAGCYTSLLEDVGKLWHDPLLQEMAMKALDDPDPQVVSSAAAYLQKWGSTEAENGLWERFVRWSTQWKDRADELRYAFITGSDQSSVYQIGAGQRLLSALAEGHGWLMDQTKLRRLIELAAGPAQRRQAEEYLRRWEQKPWTINFIPTNPPMIHIVQYMESSIESAKTKLSQFPSGTRFRWFRNTRASDLENRAFGELSAFAATLGIVIEPIPQLDGRRP